MTWIEVALLAAVFAGLLAGVILAAQRPSFWFGLGVVMFKAGMPRLIEYVSKRMPEKQEKAWRDCERRGGKWNHIKRRCE